jgi:hypothetical protein
MHLPTLVPPKLLHRLAGILAIVLVISTAVFAFGIAWIPPRRMTTTTIHGLRMRITLYVTTYGRLPASLDVLPKLPGRENATRDGWGRLISLEVKGSRVKLVSKGAPLVGSPLVWEFDAKDEDGKWVRADNLDSIRWLSHPE